jgi:hypothetical protein
MRRLAASSFFRAATTHDPVPDAAWEAWYQDIFDRECPPSVDVRGQGLAKGLTELLPVPDLPKAALQSVEYSTELCNSRI